MLLAAAAGSITAAAHAQPPPPLQRTTQGISVPLSYEKDGSGVAALKRYAAQLRDVSHQAGFGEPAAELQAKLQEAAAGGCRGVCAAMLDRGCGGSGWLRLDVSSSSAGS